MRENCLLRVVTNILENGDVCVKHEVHQAYALSLLHKHFDLLLRRFIERLNRTYRTEILDG
jgi:hypothetical protein